MLFRYIADPVGTLIDSLKPSPIPDAFGVFADGTHIESEESLDAHIIMDFAKKHISSESKLRYLVLCMFRAIQTHHTSIDSSDKLLGLFSDLFPFVITELFRYHPNDLLIGNIGNDIIQSKFRFNDALSRRNQLLVSKYQESCPDKAPPENSPADDETNIPLVDMALDDCIDMVLFICLWIAEYYEPVFGFSVLVSILNLHLGDNYSRRWIRKFVFSGCLGRLLGRKIVANTPQLITTACGLLVKCPAECLSSPEAKEYANFDTMVKVVWCFLAGMMAEEYKFSLPSSDVHSISALCLSCLISRAIGVVATMNNPRRAWLNPKLEDLTKWYLSIPPGSDSVKVAMDLNSVTPLERTLSDLEMSSVQAASALQALFIAWRSEWINQALNPFPLCMSRSLCFNVLMKLGWILIVNGLTRLSETPESGLELIHAGVRLNTHSSDYVDSVPAAVFSVLNGFSVPLPKLITGIIIGLAVETRINPDPHQIDRVKNIELLNRMITAMGPFARSRAFEDGVHYLKQELDEPLRTVCLTYFIQVFRRTYADLNRECWKLVVTCLSGLADSIENQSIIADYCTLIHEMALTVRLAGENGEGLQKQLCRQFSQKLETEYSLNTDPDIRKKVALTKTILQFYP